MFDGCELANDQSKLVNVSVQRKEKNVMAWNTFEKQRGMSSRYEKYHDKVAVIITKAGSILLTRAADEALGNPNSVNLLSDGDNGRFGIRPGNGSDAYKITRSKNAGTAKVSAVSFTNKKGLVNSRPIVIEANMEDGVLAFEKTAVLTYA